MILAVMGWKSTTITATLAANFTDLLQVKNSTHGISVSMANRIFTDANSVITSVPGSISTSSAVVGVTLAVAYRAEGVYTAGAATGDTTQDGSVYDTLGSRTLEATNIFVHQSSLNAPDGVTPGSIDYRGFANIDTSDLPPGATVTATDLRYTAFDVADDGLGFQFRINTDNTGIAGATWTLATGTSSASARRITEYCLRQDGGWLRCKLMMSGPRSTSCSRSSRRS